MMDARKLLMLAELDRLGTIAAVARSLHLTAPGVSMQLAALERELGVALTERQGRRVALTSAGSVLAEHARQIGDLMSVAEMDVSALREGVTGGYRIAAFPTIARSIIASVWGHLREAGDSTSREPHHITQRRPDSHDVPGPFSPTPGICLSVVELEPTDSLPALAAGEVHLAVAHSYSNVPSADLPALTTAPLMAEPIYLAVPDVEQGERSPAVAAESADLRDFSHADWIVPGREFTCHEMVRRACGVAGFEPRVVGEATDFSVQLAFVAAGAGVALIPQLGAVDVPRGVRLLGLVEPVVRYDYLATRASSAADAGLARLSAAIHAEASAHVRGVAPVRREQRR